jgi:hypothetical protein
VIVVGAPTAEEPQHPLSADTAVNEHFELDSSMLGEKKSLDICNSSVLGAEEELSSGSIEMLGFEMTDVDDTINSTQHHELQPEFLELAVAMHNMGHDVVQDMVCCEKQGSQKSGQSGFEHARNRTVGNGLFKFRPVWTRLFRARPGCLQGPARARKIGRLAGPAGT